MNDETTATAVQLPPHRMRAGRGPARRIWRDGLPLPGHRRNGAAATNGAQCRVARPCQRGLRPRIVRSASPTTGTFSTRSQVWAREKAWATAECA